MLKPYQELRKVDVTPYCSRKKVKDENGKEKEALYLNWAKCIDLLYENGAEKVSFEPIRNEDGTFLFPQKETEDRKGSKGQSYFIAVNIRIDDKAYRMDAPLMMGNIPVKDATLNQLRINTAHQRAFVKGVAIYTGLGLGLWADGDADEEAAPREMDEEAHDIFVIKRRVEEKITAAMKRGMEKKDICARLRINEKQMQGYLDYYARLNTFERALERL